MNIPKFVQLEVLFERDMRSEALPFLGQLGLCGSLHALAGEELLIQFLNVIPPSEIFHRVCREIRKGNVETAFAGIPAPATSKWFPAEQGWKAVARIKAGLQDPAAVEKASIKGFEGEVSEELDRLMSLLQEAEQANIRFRFDLQENNNPAEALIRCVQKQNEELAEFLTKTMEDLGHLGTDQIEL